MPAGDRKLTYEEMDRASVEAMQGLPRARVRVVLEDLRSGHNVGSIFRTADAFRLEGIDLCGFTPTPPNREVEKTALGATRTVPWRQHQKALPVLEGLKGEGYCVMAVEQTLQAVPIQAWTPPPGRPLALVFGNELQGVSHSLIEACEGALIVPQHGSKHSLNVSVCAGIVLWWVAGCPQGGRIPPP